MVPFVTIKKKVNDFFFCIFLYRLYPDGSYKSISYNDQVRAPYQLIPVEDVVKVYRALKMFFTEANKEDKKIEIKLQGGRSNSSLKYNVNFTE